MSAQYKIKRVLIANRGEIARRIHRACTGLGLEAVLAVSDPDVGSLAASEVGEVAAIGGSSARDSYLNAEKLVAAALRHGCQAIHPGYGFLSEDAAFAERVRDAGLVFVGPSPESIRALGVKTSARKTVQAAGVPITPGSGDASSDEELSAAAAAIGFPVIIKAAAGGGGRGMRIVRSAAEIGAALESARAEAVKSFGSAAVYCEKFIEQPRHVEVQLFGDMHGSVVHLGTRDCSAQRRHQKLVEEAPAPFLSSQLREQIHAAALAAARSVGYYNAGTAEFLVKGEEFYFLEINTRIQVEHPVTEAVTGIDLVQLQLRVAMGEPLPFTQQEVQFSGHAIELRINAEDVFEGFRPALGTITEWRRPNGACPGMREDCGYAVGGTVTPFYDSLLSKVIAHGASRQEALYRCFDFLRGYVVRGVETSVPFHAWILSNPDFQGDGIDIGYVERVFTGEQARDALNLLRVDPEHRGVGPMPPHGCDPVERVYRVDQHGQRCGVDLVHERGGTFLAIPLTSEGVPLPQAAWRRSLSRSTALAGA